jgi:hypothetical protein
LNILNDWNVWTGAIPMPNGAQRLNVWNHWNDWNGLQYYLNGLNEAQRLNGWNDWNGNFLGCDLGCQKIFFRFDLICHFRVVSSPPRE